MQLSTLAALACATAVSAKNILMTNDDGWLSTGIRATYRELTAAGHNVYMVAPAEQRSGYGGSFMYTDTNVLLHDDQFHYKKAGDAAWGHDSVDDHLWYFNATPAACVAFAFDYLLPTYFANVSIDLVVSGPNQGVNPFDYFTLSGTIGATYNAVFRGYPAIGISGSNENNTFYQDSLNTDPIDPQNIYASKIVELVDTLFASQGDNSRTLPLGVGLTVNLPLVSTDSEDDCMNPEFTFCRLTGAKISTAGLAYNSATNEFDWADVPAVGDAVQYNGDLSLPTEDEALAMNCRSTISAFSIDFTAPITQQNQVKGMIESILA